VKGADQFALLALLDRLREIGGEYEILQDGMRFYRGARRLRGTTVDTHYHPGFMSDWQPPLAVALTQAQGQSIIHETVYEDRFRYVEGLVEMGAQVKVRAECLGAEPCRFQRGSYDHSCVIHGPTALRATQLTMPDLRGGFAYAVAAMLADGTTRLFGIDHIARGYADFTEKAVELGASITAGAAADAADDTLPLAARA